MSNYDEVGKTGEADRIYETERADGSSRVDETGKASRSDRRGKPGKAKSALAIIIAVLVLAAAAGLAIIKFSSEDYEFTKDTNPLNVNVSLAKDTIAKEIAEKGGEIALSGSNGQESSLKIDEGSLFESTKISATSITAISGFDKEWKYVAGVQLSPSGTKFVKPCELKVNVPKDQPENKLVGFSYEGDGNDFQFYPVEIKDGIAVFSVDGFSGFGLINVGDSEIEPPQPSSIEGQAKQYIAGIVREARNNGGGINDDYRRRIANILRGWYNASIKIKLQQASDNPDVLEPVLLEFFSWSKFVQFYGLEKDLLKPEVDGFNAAFVSAKDKAVQKIVEKCVSEKDPSQISKLQHVYCLLVRLEQIWGFEGLNPGAVLEKIKKLASFELKITEHIRMKMKEYSEDILAYTVDGSGSVPIRVTASSERGAFWLGGEGQFQLSNSLLHVNIPKDFPVTDVASGLVYGFITMMNGDHKEPMSQAYKIGVPDIPLLISGDKDVQISFDVSPQGSEADFPWLSEIFRPFHRDVCTGHYFKLTGWNIAGKRGVFANKVHTHTGSIEDMDLTEETTYQLLFTPKAD